MDADKTDSEIRAIFSAFSAKLPQFASLRSTLPALSFHLQEKQLLITFKYNYYREFFKQNFQVDFEAMARACLGNEVVVIYSESPEGFTSSKLRPCLAQIDPFADFIENTKNSFALAAAKKICRIDEFELLILIGPSDSGKSCLLEATASELAHVLGWNKIHKCRAQAFNGSMPPEEFWNNHRALILDDLQDLASDTKAQHLLAAYIDCAQERNRPMRIIFAISVGSLAIFEARLACRLERGLIIELPAPDLALRIAYVEKQVAQMGLSLQKGQIVAMARHNCRISILAGLLQKLKFYDSFSGQTLTPDELEKLALPENSESGWQRIITHVSERLGVKTTDILGGSRKREIARARQVAMFLCRSRLGLSYPDLGRIFGGKDHSTVIHSIRKIQQIRQTDKVLHKILTELEAERV